MKKVFGFPTPDTATRDTGSGISQVVLALARELPAFGYELVNAPQGADLIANHAGAGEYASDVAFVHGLYPTGRLSMERWHDEVNARVIDDVRGAKAVIVPSEWVADLFRRDMHLDPYVIQWGVHLETWRHNDPHEGYVLWNKNRTEGVCTPEWVNLLARRRPDTQFVSTFGDSLPNLRLTGKIPHDQMRPLIQRAAVYLATTKETGDIGSREALAAGVPVLGFRHGALPDLIQHGVNGFLAEPGDTDGLLRGLDFCLKHRDALSRNAVRYAHDWKNAAHQVAAVFDSVLAPSAPIAVSVVIPCYNYAAFVEEAVQSAFDQPVTFDTEVIVVNDGSTDTSKLVLDDLKKKYPALKVIHQNNQGVAHARNNGIRAAKGRYIACLDADDVMRPGFLQVCFDALEKDRGLGIAYTRIETRGVGLSPWLAGQFNYGDFIERKNQIPSLCMFRKEAWQRAGGYRQYMHTAEDADLWLRIVTLGYRARKVSEQPLFLYRMHDNSASSKVRTAQKREPDWVGDKGYLTPRLMPFAAPTLNGRAAWPVEDYDQPLVSIIIPVGKGHETLVQRALDSVEGQAFRQWECLLINDTGAPLSLMGRPYVRLLETDGKQGAGKARNLGLKAARGRTVVFLDADDVLLPTFLSRAYERHVTTGRYVYTDWYLYRDGHFEPHTTPEFDPAAIYKDGLFHTVTVLVDRLRALRVGGFDEGLPAWEDWDFFMKLIADGTCGVRLADPLVVYRMETGARREAGLKQKPDLEAVLLSRYEAFIRERETPVCNCGQKKPVIAASGSMVEILYHGAAGNHLVTGVATKTRYGRRSRGDRFYVYAQDAAASPHLFEMIAEIEVPAPQTIMPPEPV